MRIGSANMKKSLFDSPQFGYDEVYFEESYPFGGDISILTSHGFVYKSKKEYIEVDVVWDTGSDKSSIPSFIVDKWRLQCKYTGNKVNTGNGQVDERLCTVNFIIENKNEDCAFQCIDYEVRVNDSDKSNSFLLLGMDIIGSNKFYLHNSHGTIGLIFDTSR